MDYLEDFRKNAYNVIDWIVEYYKNIEHYPVKSKVKPGDIKSKISDIPPDVPEKFKKILHDFCEDIIPGVTHWQSPNFYAYFPSNTSTPSILAELIMAAMGVQGMKWETSPSATELEEVVMNWLKQMLNLPGDWHGVIQDSASTATLCAIITAREKACGYKINENGIDNNKLRVYCSSEAHSSVEKAVKIAGLGKNNLVKTKLNKEYGLETSDLINKIEQDISHGKIPVCVVAAFGTTGSTAIDPVKEIAMICRKYNIWLHVDAAFAGTALILPEYSKYNDGISMADSFVFNPHKWMFTNFDCSAFFVKDREALINTFAILPEYLKTDSDHAVNNYCDWGIQLGRRFRSLKLWFVIKSFGVNGLRNRIRKHLELAKYFAENVNNDENFEILAPVHFNLVCFRFKPMKIADNQTLNSLNRKLLQKINETGKIYLTHTTLSGNYTLRMVISQTSVEKEHVRQAWELIKEYSKKLKYL